MKLDKAELGNETTLAVWLSGWDMNQMVAYPKWTKVPELPWHTIEEDIQRLKETETLERIYHLRPGHPA